MQKGYSYKVSEDEVRTARLYNTDVLTVTNKNITFRSGGWITPSTVTAINQGLADANLTYMLKANIKNGEIVITNKQTDEIFKLTNNELFLYLRR